MPVALPTTITAAGEAAAIAAHNAGLDLQITHVALGAGAYTPAGSETALADRREAVAISGGSRTGPSQVTIQALLRSFNYSGAAYTIGEVGFYAGNPDAGGVLFGVASSVGANFGGRGGGVLSDFLATFVLNLSGVPTGSVNVTVDPTAGASFLMLQATDTTPIGAVVGFLASSAPPGWLPLAGAQVNRADYPDLWAHAIASGLLVTEAAWAAGAWTMFSSGNGNTTFRLPDWRGESARFADLGRGVVPGFNVGSWQSGQVQRHKHLSMGESSSRPSPFGNTNTQTHWGTEGSDNDNWLWLTNDGSDFDGTVNAAGVIGDENRVRSGGLLACIKAGLKTIPAAPTPAPSPAPIPPPPPPPPVGPAPVASFTMASSGTVDLGALGDESPHEVAFTDTSTNSPTSWAWNFGNGSTSTLRNPVHVFTNTGLDAVDFTVSLIATNANGSSAAATQVVRVFGTSGGGGGA